MKIEYDRESDIINIEFLQGIKIDESVEEDGVIFDFSKDKKLVSVEILDANKRIGKDPLEKIDFSITKDKVIAVWDLVPTNPEGNLLIKGTLAQNQASPLSPTLSSFIVQNKTGATVAYINSTGFMFVTGALTENVLFE